MRKKDDLALETRRRIFELLMDSPGLHFREIVRRLDMSASNAEYHLRYLVKSDVLVVVEDGRLKRFYVRGKVDHDDKCLLALLRRENVRGVVLFLLLNPGSSFEDVLDAFDFHPDSLSRIMDRLIDGCVVRDDDESFFVANPDALARLLIAFRPSFTDSLVDSFVDGWLGDTKKGKKRRKG